MTALPFPAWTTQAAPAAVMPRAQAMPRRRQHKQAKVCWPGRTRSEAMKEAEETAAAQAKEAEGKAAAEADATVARAAAAAAAAREAEEQAAEEAKQAEE